MATLLWILVGIFSGLTIGMWFEADFRRQLFYAVFGAGSMLLIRINVSVTKLSASKLKAETHNFEMAPAQNDAGMQTQSQKLVRQAAAAGNVVDRLLAVDGRLDNHQAIEWLDHVLLRQQERPSAGSKIKDPEHSIIKASN